MTDPFRYRKVLIEADGGSRGNPGPAAYGAVLKDAETGEVIAEDGSTIGVATNNVAEYSGLIGGLRLAEEFAPHAEIEVRMDSKLVVEQMSGRWKIKHPDMKPLAMEANGLAPFGTTYTWMPREQNAHADRLANEALDGMRNGVTTPDAMPAEPDDSLIEEIEDPAPGPDARRRPQPARLGPPTASADHAGPGPARRHRRTRPRKRFSGGLGGDNPGLSDEGRAQVRATADWLAPLAERDRRRGVVAGTTDPGVRRDPRRGAGPARRGGARLRRDGVRRLGRADLRRGRRARQGRPRGLAGPAGPRRPRAASRSETVEARVLAGARPGARRRTRAGPSSWSAT